MLLLSCCYGVGCLSGFPTSAVIFKRGEASLEKAYEAVLACGRLQACPLRAVVLAVACLGNLHSNSNEVKPMRDFCVAT